MIKVIVEADGGSRGNPGPAAYGAVVFSADHHTVLAERKKSLGVTTNNVAEYNGLIAGLRAAEKLGAREVDVRMDSKLVVQQMSGRWKVRHPDMLVLFEQAKSLAAGFDRVRYSWIPRANNAHADRLANEAMDAARDGIPVVGTGHNDIDGDETEDNDLTDRDAPRIAPQPPTSRLVVHGGGEHSWLGRGPATTRLLLLRHGQTELSAQQRYSGRGNPPLTELGLEQARLAAKRLAAVGGVDAVVSSPLDRARTTAEHVAAELGLPVRTVDGWVETDFGDWEGLTFAEAAARDPQRHVDWLGNPAVAPPGGESFDRVRTRVNAELDALLEAYPEGTVLVIGHVTPIKTVLQLALDAGPSVLYRLHLDLASMSVVHFHPDGLASVRLVNDTSHLRE